MSKKKKRKYEWGLEPKIKKSGEHRKDCICFDCQVATHYQRR